MKNKFKAFTLIELIIVITITGLIALGINNISLTNISEAQKVGIFYNKIRSNIESSVNNSLIGKAIDSNLKVPKYWKISIDSNTNGTGFGTGGIIVKYGSGTFKIHTGYTVKSPNFYSVENINCNNLLKTNLSNENNIDLIIEEGNITLSGCTDTDARIIDFNLKYKKYTKHISINSVNNVIN